MPHKILSRATDAEANTPNAMAKSTGELVAAVWHSNKLSILMLGGLPILRISTKKGGLQWSSTGNITYTGDRTFAYSRENPKC